MNVTIPYLIWKNANICKATNDIRYYLNGVHVKGMRTESSNGHYAYTGEYEGFCVGGVQQEFDGDIIINPKNKVPTSTKSRPIDRVVIDWDESESLASVKYVDFNGVQLAADIATIIDADYPDLDKVTPKYSEEMAVAFRGGFMPEYLSILQKLSPKKYIPVIMETVKEGEIVCFHLSKTYGYSQKFVLMQCRIDG